MGFSTADDAGVYLIDDDTALVQTIDVITPVVDDPADYGSIAAVNALSDIYAMGGKPVTALSFLAFDPCKVPAEIIGEILEGSLSALADAGTTLLGGHTLEDPELKFGFAVTGTVRADSFVTNSGASAGDMIYLTKPLGTGISATAAKGSMVPADLLSQSTAWMKTSNLDASTAMLKSGASAATDVTGFGLLGHLAEMCRPGGLGALVDHDTIPVMHGVRELVTEGLVPEGAYNNRKYLEGFVDTQGLEPEVTLPLYDPQTSGGLLVAISPERSDILEMNFGEAGVFFARIGLFTGKRGIKIVSGL